jgi:hypothetical protein
VSGGGSFDNDAFAEAATAGGEAVATLTSGETPGTATVRAGTDLNEEPMEVRGIVQEVEVVYTPGSVSLLIVPNTVLGTGEETCDATADNCAEIVATLEDVNGDPPDAGEAVSFSLESSVGMTQKGSIQIQNDGLSNEAGVVNAVYLAPDQGGEVTVTATWTTQGVEVTGSETITVHPPPATINVAEGFPNPKEISVKGTGGLSTSQLVFEVSDGTLNEDGTPSLVEDGYRVDFSILSGPGGGELLTPAFDITQNGRVSTVLRSGFKSGPVSVKATYFHNSNVSTVTSQILVKAGPPVGEEFGVAAEYLNISGLSIFGLEDIITINAGDRYGNAVPDGTAIAFKTYNTGGLIENEDGTGEGQATTTTTSGGFARSILNSTASPQPLEGFVSVTAEANGGRTTHVTSIDLVPEDFNAKDNYIMYVGTDGGGVYKSINSGTTWRSISRDSQIPGQNWIAPYVNDIAVDRDNVNIVYAATGYLGNGNIYRSIDGGLNWNSGSDEEWFGLKSYSLAGLKSAALTVICDYDDADVPIIDYPSVWAGSQGNGIFYSLDGTIFQTPAEGSALRLKGTVNEVVRVKGTHNDPINSNIRAILYAGTASGVYKSVDGGQTWFQGADGPLGTPHSFPNNHITALAIHSSSTGGQSDVLYAGTEDAGVWVSTDSGENWTPFREGLGKGLRATIPIADKRNTGTGTMSDVSVGPEAESENWTVVYGEDPDNPDNLKFIVTGSVSGPQSNTAAVGSQYVSDNGQISFTISGGGVPFEEGDTFTFKTTRDPGNNIKDVLVDEDNNRLYVVTYFEGPNEPHPVGNLYYHELRSDESGFMNEGAFWVEANNNLPEFDPPDDETLFGLHALARSEGVSGETTALFVGGEGINFYKADSGLSSGTPDWVESSGGSLTNLIMARMPVLFSGTCSMEIKAFVNGVPSFFFKEGDFIRFEIYVQDVNGNPPIIGSNINVRVEREGQDDIVLLNRDYTDGYTASGTWRDESAPETDNPYILFYTGGAGDEIMFTFTPTCEDGAPGCSGTIQEQTFTVQGTTPVQ